MRRGPRGSTTRTHFIKASARWLGLADRLLLEPNSIHQVSAPSRSRGLLHCDTFQICMPTLLVVQKLGKSRWLRNSISWSDPELLPLAPSREATPSCRAWRRPCSRNHRRGPRRSASPLPTAFDRLQSLASRVIVRPPTCAHKQFPRAGRDGSDASTLDLRLNRP